MYFNCRLHSQNTLTKSSIHHCLIVMSSFSAYELWFKQIIFELDSVRAKFNSEVRILYA